MKLDESSENIGSLDVLQETQAFLQQALALFWDESLQELLTKIEIQVRKVACGEESSELPELARELEAIVFSRSDLPQDHPLRGVHGGLRFVLAGILKILQK